MSQKCQKETHAPQQLIGLYERILPGAISRTALSDKISRNKPSPG